MTTATMDMFPEIKMFVTSYKCHKGGTYGLFEGSGKVSLDR